MVNTAVITFSTPESEGSKLTLELSSRDPNLPMLSIRFPFLIFAWMSLNEIPLHNFPKPELVFRFEELVHLNEYDAARPHRHNYYEIFLFTQGDGYHMIDFNHIPISGGSIHFVSPGQVHLVNRGLRSSGMVVKFSRELISAAFDRNVLHELPFLHNRSSKPAIELSGDQRHEIEQLFLKIKEEFYGDDADKEELIKSYLQLILLKCKRLYQEKDTQKAPGNDTLEKYRQLVEENFSSIHQVKDYAEKLAISPHHLNELAKKLTGKHASDFISERLLLESKRLLAHSGLSVKEISFQLGFSDPSYFSRFFSQHSGTSPNAFRSGTREKYKF